MRIGGAAEVKGFGGLGAAEALTVDRRAEETDCVDDSSPWRTGAVAAPRCKLRVSERGAWNGMRTGGPESVREPRARSAILIS